MRDPFDNMRDPFDGRSRNLRTRWILGVLVMLGAIGLLLYQYRWIRSVYQGPVALTLPALKEATDPAAMSNPWVSFTFEEAIDTGIVLENKKGNDATTTSKFLLIRVVDRWLIAEVPADFSGNQLVGYLDTRRSRSSKEAIEKIESQFSDRDFLPFQCNAEYSYKGECYAMVGSVGFIFFAGLCMIGYVWKDLRTMKRMASQS